MCHFQLIPAHCQLQVFVKLSQHIPTGCRLHQNISIYMTVMHTSPPAIMYLQQSLSEHEHLLWLPKQADAPGTTPIKHSLLTQARGGQMAYLHTTAYYAVVTTSWILHT